MTVTLSCEAIRALLQGSESGPSRMLDFEIEKALTGRNARNAPRYTDAVAGLAPLYKAIYALFPEAVVSISPAGCALSCLVMIDDQLVYHSTHFTNHAYALIDILFHLKGAWDEAAAEEMAESVPAEPMVDAMAV